MVTVSTKPLDEYIDVHADILGRQAERVLQPLHVPGKDPLAEGIERMLRQPFPGQAHAITALIRRLDISNTAYLVGQMGVGKSLVSCIAAHLHARGNPYRALILCPKHLLSKWPRELKRTLPDVEVKIIKTWKDAVAIEREVGRAPTKATWYVIARDTAKLGSGWREAVVYRKTNSNCMLPPKKDEDPQRCSNKHCPKCHGTGKVKVPTCPGCGNRTPDTDSLGNRKQFCKCIIDKQTGEHVLDADEPGKGQRYCNTPLFVHIPKPRRWPPYLIIKQRLPRGFFDYFIGDECHEGRNPSAAQGHSLATLLRCAKKTILATGTISTGDSESLRPMMFYTSPTNMVGMGFEWNKPQPFNERYGRIETHIREREPYGGDNRQSKGSVSKRKKVVPGIMPNFFADHMLEQAVFLSLDDVSEALPEYSEHVVTCDMAGEQRDHYEQMKDHLRNVVSEMLRQNDRRLLGPMLTALLAWPDYPFDWKAIGYKDQYLSVSGWKKRYCKVWEPASLSRSIIYPKEQELLDLCAAERAEGRKSWVYVQYTDTHDVAGRLKELLEAQGMKVGVMRASVQSDKREAWIAEHAPKCDVIISHPKLVETGVDFFDREPQTYNIPTIIFYECGYQPITLRQAAARAYRIGQDEACRVYFMHYEGMQEQALALMGRKINQSQALEGKFSAEGLAALDTDSMEVALARSLVENISDSAARHWEKLGSPKAPAKPKLRFVETKAMPRRKLSLKIKKPQESRESQRPRRRLNLKVGRPKLQLVK